MDITEMIENALDKKGNSQGQKTPEVLGTERFVTYRGKGSGRKARIAAERWLSAKIAKLLKSDYNGYFNQIIRVQELGKLAKDALEVFAELDGSFLFYEYVKDRNMSLAAWIDGDRLIVMEDAYMALLFEGLAPFLRKSGQGQLADSLNAVRKLGIASPWSNLHSSTVDIRILKAHGSMRITFINSQDQERSYTWHDVK
jgi:hypothetical protein